MKVVLDTNLLVSALINAKGVPAQVLQLATDGSLTVCYDARILIEYQKVLSRPEFPFSPEEVASLLETLQQNGEPVIADAWLEPLPDPDDRMFIEVAREARAHCLVTGNMKHFPPAKCGGVRVLTPAQFVTFYRNASRK